MKNKATWIILALALIAVGIYIWWKKKQETQIFKPSVTPEENPALPASSFCKYGDSFPLKYGSCGENVKLIQQKLGGLQVDGKYGMKTQEKVQSVIYKITVSQEDFNQIIGGNSSTGNLNSNIDSLAIQIKEDDEAWRITPRTGSETLWQSVLALSDTNLGKLADLYYAKYKETLYSTIDAMWFFGDKKVDIQILNKLSAIKKAA